MDEILIDATVGAAERCQHYGAWESRDTSMGQQGADTPEGAPVLTAGCRRCWQKERDCIRKISPYGRFSSDSGRGLCISG